MFCLAIGFGFGFGFGIGPRAERCSQRERNDATSANGS